MYFKCDVLNCERLFLTAEDVIKHAADYGHCGKCGSELTESETHICQECENNGPKEAA